ncbi:hypothetical protein FOXG_22399 [Fusarium oxysporum f. sp. lycopersici 4287]|uniref:Uncharacterized protein n=1 Tax=Fusarium oxysporum f. sp. lycopersici (strain 4287 / CBS 123668 / FGSC 9935 / NRRL 34936) TaxID=426428 RepID=A0A0J9W763_FUSO4|nr:hypothetical protein FOXG_19453 [Fusarium oxysporum f. sp. lycopersici 4287]XP_018256683.1 hypothetical protein FOXG_22316 [Fusarium oxysporum f. sp. lycopersici 4287]XP_018256897.1 hypothetical protein FOXG_22399 [Fusarium oxysporum f. sp. lycopersici 4287]KNB04908.1 hypothetical protein FOXG_19453 [Fusarium oxysporum f. sp. lycopersici 4287]KNB18638.1 hypothetical protein FOXG_22316 [Fusarium oxysporum f. sp. lycopersici 4287]KNB18852.1 hypothetical protein FOXG_22399 [Fusarium oxysporum 
MSSRLGDASPFSVPLKLPYERGARGVGTRASTNKVPQRLWRWVDHLLVLATLIKQQAKPEGSAYQGVRL